MQDQRLTTEGGTRTGQAIIEPDDQTWDRFVRGHPHGHLLQASGWGALKARFGWQPRRLAIADPPDGRAEPRLRAGAQILFRHRLGFGLAYVPRGPLLAGDEATDALLLAALEQLARRNRAVFLRLEPNILEDDAAANKAHSFLLLRGFQPASPIQPRSTVHLDLGPPDERLLAGMSKGHRADIRRAAREGVVVRNGTSQADLDAFYALMTATGRRAGFAIHSRAYYHAAWELFADDARLLLAERDDTALAGSLIVAWAGTGLYLYSGSTEAGLKSGANHALQWSALRWAKERGCTIYDFWGIPDALGRAAAESTAARERLETEAQNDPLYGVFRFKKGFGGRVVRYLPAYDRVYLPALYALWQRRLRG